MRLLVQPGSALRTEGSGEVRVPGDKSIAHRWLILAVTARGTSALRGLPTSLDVRSTAMCLASLGAEARPALERWLARPQNEPVLKGQDIDEGQAARVDELTLNASGRDALGQPEGGLDCGNSGTTMRLLAGVAATLPFRIDLTGDGSLRSRPMERVAEPLRLMGANVRTRGGRAPLVVGGGGLRGIRYALPVPSAQVKGAVLLAGLSAEGETTVAEPVATRDHTERALDALGAPVRRSGSEVTVSAFQHGGFEGALPGDPSAAAFLLGAAAVTRSTIRLAGVGVNPSRTRFLEVLDRMGSPVRSGAESGPPSLGEPLGWLEVGPDVGLTGTTVTAEELPLVIDEVPLLAAVAAHASGETRFEGGGELRVKESDRLSGLAAGIRTLGGAAAVEGDALVVGGGGLPGGRADAGRDHRLAMALAVAALAAAGPTEVGGMEWAEVSFPGFVPALRGLGARIEVAS